MPTTTKHFLVMLKPIRELQLYENDRIQINPFKLDEKGYSITIGHGMNHLIPHDYFRIEKETINKSNGRMKKTVTVIGRKQLSRLID